MSFRHLASLSSGGTLHSLAGRGSERLRTPANAPIAAVLAALNVRRRAKEAMRTRCLADGAFEYLLEGSMKEIPALPDLLVPRGAVATWFACNTACVDGTRSAMWCGLVSDAAAWIEREVTCGGAAGARRARLRILLAGGPGRLFECIGAERPELCAELAVRLARPLLTHVRSLGSELVARGLEQAVLHAYPASAAEILGVVSQQLRRAWLAAWTQELARRAPHLASINVEIRYEISAEAYCPLVGAATLTSIDNRSTELYQLESEPFFERNGEATPELEQLREITGHPLPDRHALAHFLYDLCDLALAQYRYDCRSTIELRSAAPQLWTETPAESLETPQPDDAVGARGLRVSHRVPQADAGVSSV
jgi:hypothetical protein